MSALCRDQGERRLATNHADAGRITAVRSNPFAEEVFLQLAATPACVVRTAPEFQAAFVATGERHQSFTCPFCGVPLEEIGVYTDTEAWWWHTSIFPPQFVLADPKVPHRRGCDGHSAPVQECLEDAANRRQAHTRRRATAHSMGPEGVAAVSASLDTRPPVAGNLAPILSAGRTNWERLLTPAFRAQAAELRAGLRYVAGLDGALVLPDRFLPVRRRGVSIPPVPSTADVPAEEVEFRRHLPDLAVRDADYATPLLPSIVAAEELLGRAISDLADERGVVNASEEWHALRRAVARQIPLALGATATNYHDAFVLAERVWPGPRIYHGADGVLELRDDCVVLRTTATVGRPRSAARRQGGHAVLLVIPNDVSPDQPRRRAEVFRYLEPGGRFVGRWYAYGSLVWRDALRQATPTGWYELRIESLDHLHLA